MNTFKKKLDEILSRAAFEQIEAAALATLQDAITRGLHLKEHTNNGPHYPDSDRRVDRLVLVNVNGDCRITIESGVR